MVECHGSYICTLQTAQKSKGNGRGRKREEEIGKGCLVNILPPGACDGVTPLVEVVSRHCSRNETFWYLTFKATTKIEEYKIIKTAEQLSDVIDERSESSCVVIRHSVWSVSLLEEVDMIRCVNVILWVAVYKNGSRPSLMSTFTKTLRYSEEFCPQPNFRQKIIYIYIYIYIYMYIYIYIILLSSSDAIINVFLCFI